MKHGVKREVPDDRGPRVPSPRGRRLLERSPRLVICVHSSLSSLVYAVCEATSRYRQLSFATIHRQRTVTTSGELTNDNATTQFQLNF